MLSSPSVFADAVFEPWSGDRQEGERCRGQKNLLTRRPMVSAPWSARSASGWEQTVRCYPFSASDLRAPNQRGTLKPYRLIYAPFPVLSTHAHESCGRAGCRYGNADTQYRGRTRDRQARQLLVAARPRATNCRWQPQAEVRRLSDVPVLLPPPDAETSAEARAATAPARSPSARPQHTRLLAQTAAALRSAARFIFELLTNPFPR